MGKPLEEKSLYTFEEYQAYESSSKIRSEYYYGEVFAMAGATQNHNLITLNVAAMLRGQARKQGGRAFASDMKLYSRESGFRFLTSYNRLLITGL